MKNLIERQSQLLQTMFWTYVELIGIDHSEFTYRFSDNGQAMLLKLRNQLAADLKVNPQEVQDHAEECATNIYYFNNPNT